VYQVVFDLPGGRRVTALWNGDGAALGVRIPRQAAQARVVTAIGDAQAAVANGADWVLTLPAATAHFAGDPPGYYFIGGEPRLVVEEGVAADAPVVAPRLAR
jgi:hypothetical protein